MKKLLFAHKKIIAFVLSVMLLLGAMPMGFALAAGEVVVVDSTGTLTNGATDENGNVIVLKDTISAAIDYLGAAGGTVYIKGTYEVAKDGKNIEGTVENRAEVVIEGYGGVADNTIDFSNLGYSYSIALKGEITLQNLNVGTLETSSSFSSTYNAFFGASGYTLTFGRNLTMLNGRGLAIGGRGANLVDIYSGKYAFVAPWAYKSGDDRVYDGSTYNIYDGRVYYLTNVPLSYNSGTPSIDTDFVANVYGGTIDNIHVGGGYGKSGALGYAQANSIFNLEDGKFTNIWLGSWSLDSSSKAKTPGDTGNIAIIVNGSKTQTSISTIKSHDNAQYIKKGSGKKFIAIINNAEGEKAVFDFDSDPNLKAMLDYKVEVIGGEARPVFEGTGASSTLLGFTLKDKDDAGLVPAINGEALTAKGTTEDGDSYYELPSTLGSTDITEVTFMQAETDEPVENPVVVVDKTGTLNDGDEAIGGGTIVLKNTITEAIDYLGEEGGTIYIKGTYTPSAVTELEGTLANRDLVTIEGYGGATDNVLNVASLLLRIPLKGDLTFQNLTIAGPAASENLQDNFNNAAYSYGYELTFGENLNVTGVGLPIGCRIYGNNAGGYYSNIINIHSGLYYTIAPTCYKDGASSYTANVNYNIFGGTVEYFFTAPAMAKDGDGPAYLNGDYVVNVNGGHIKRAFLGTWASKNLGYVKGNTILNIEDGKVPTVTFGYSYVGSTGKTQTPEEFGNIALVVNGSKSEASVTTINGNDNASYIKKASGKKFVAIINNAEGNKAVFADELHENFVNAFDYKISVTGGEAQPVFEGTGASATLLGFSLTASDAQKSTPSINGVALEPVGTTDDGVVYYTIPSTLGTENITEINFVNELPILDGEHYVKYGGTGIGNSASSPAPSVAWLINNVIADNYDADDEVIIYVMQDDAEILYNSTIYANGGAGYTAPVIGGDGYKVPEHHITSWYSAADGTPKPHKATIRIKSYADGSSAQNYLATYYQLGWNYTLNLQGPTVFEDINILNPYSSLCNIAANGFDYTISEATERYTINASRYKDEHQWNGVFTKTDKWHSTTLGAGSDKDFFYNTVAPGGYLTINKTIKMEWVVNKTDSSTQRFILGSAVNNTVFTGTIGAIINTPSHLSLDIGSGDEAKANVINGNVNIIVNSQNAKLYIRGLSTKNTTIGGAIQIIRASDTFLGGVNNVEDYGVPFWNIQTVNAVGILDVTDTAGKYALTDASLTVVAVKKGTNKVIISKDGYLDLTAYGAGEYDVYSANAAEGDYLNFDKAIYAVKDVTIDLATVKPTITEGVAFLGWKLDGEYVNGTSATLSAGQVLVGEFAEFSTAANGDFFVDGIQMRVDGTQGVRFVLQLNSAAAAIIGGQQNVIDFGSLILPVEYSQGRDLRYGEEIVVAGTNYGAPTIVPAKNIWAQSDEFIQYTVVVTGISENKFMRYYAVQGYLRYYDANGVEQILYSGYGQSSLYRVALHIANDEAAPESHKAAAQTVIDYVQGEDFKASYDAAMTKTPVEVFANNSALSAYKLANGLTVAEFDINWYNNGKVTDIVQLSDIHFSYQNSLDKYIAYETTADSFESGGRQYYYGLPTALNAYRIMQFAMFADQTVISGDITDYVSNGTLQMADRLLFGYNTNVNGYSTVMATVGNHESLESLGTPSQTCLDSSKSTDEIFELVQGVWDNDISFYNKLVTNGDGGNAVMVVTMDNWSNVYTDETIPAKLSAAIAEAREAGAPVIIFQHVPIDGVNEQLVLAEGTFAEENKVGKYGAFEAEDTLSNTVYKLITDNADVIKGVFCGHIHSYEYNEIIGTDANNTVIPQIAIGATHLDGGYALKINIK